MDKHTAVIISLVSIVFGFVLGMYVANEAFIEKHKRGTVHSMEVELKEKGIAGEFHWQFSEDGTLYMLWCGDTKRRPTNEEILKGKCPKEELKSALKDMTQFIDAGSSDIVLLEVGEKVSCETPEQRKCQKQACPEGKTCSCDKDGWLTVYPS